MNHVALHPMPRWGAVMREQFRAVGDGVRRELLACIALLVGLMALSFITRGSGGQQPSDLSPDDLGFMMVWLGLLAPLAVWKGENPGNRGYLWSLPLPRARHTLVKVFSGWVWLMILIAALFALMALQALLTDGALGEIVSGYVLHNGIAVPPSGVAVEPSALQAVQWQTQGWEWFAPFIAPTVTYLIGSILVLASDHPWRWLAAPFIAFAVLSAFDAEIRWAERLVEQLASGAYSMETLATGGNESAMRVQTTTGDRALLWQNLPNAQQWFTTVAIWFFPALAGLLMAAHHYQER